MFCDWSCCIYTVKFSKAQQQTEHPKFKVQDVRIRNNVHNEFAIFHVGGDEKLRIVA